MCTTRTVLNELLHGDETRVWSNQCRQVGVSLWRVETDRIRGAGRCARGSAPGIDPVALLRCLPWFGDPALALRAAADMLGWDRPGKRHELAGIGEAGDAAKLGHRCGRGHQNYAAQCLQRLYPRCERPLRQRLLRYVPPVDSAGPSPPPWARFVFYDPLWAGSSPASRSWAPPPKSSRMVRPVRRSARPAVPPERGHCRRAGRRWPAAFHVITLDAGELPATPRVLPSRGSVGGGARRRPGLDVIVPRSHGGPA